MAQESNCQLANFPLVPTTLRILRRSPQAQVRLEIDGGQLSVVKEVSADGADRLAREAEALRDLHELSGLPELLEHSALQLRRTYLPGRTLRSLCRRQRWPRLQIQAWMDRLRLLLEQIHARGHWHGDVCPANILIGPDQSVALLDWGSPEWGTPPYRVLGEKGPAADWRGWNHIGQEMLQGQSGMGQDVPRLVGREQELARLRHYWQKTPHSEAIWLGISAPSGGGKTALLEEMLGWSEQAVLARCSTLTSPLGYQLFQSLLEHAGWPVDGQGMSDPEWQQFQSTFPGVHPQPAQTKSVSTFTPLLVAEAWNKVLTLQASRWPLLLLLDDMQWTDTPTQYLLELLSQRTIPGLMVVLAWRQQEWHPPKGLLLQSHLSLSPLQPHHVMEWSQRHQIEVDPQQAQLMAQWSGGSPLLIGEWLRNPGQPVFSTKVGGLLRQRIQQIPTKYLAVLQVAALMGSEFEGEPLAMAGPWPEALSWAQEQQLVLPGLRFSHDQVREALLETLSPEEGKHWHTRLGEYFSALEPVDAARCAFHLWQGGQPSTAAPYALQAARREQLRSPHSAAFYYDIYCCHDPTPEVILEYSQVLELLGQHPVAEHWLTQALQVPQGNSEVSEIYLRLSRHAYARGDHPQTLGYAGLAWRQLKSSSLLGHASLRGQILHAEWEAHFTSGRAAPLARFLIFRLPMMALCQRHDPVFRADLLHLGAALGIQPPTWARVHVLRSLHRENDPLKKSRAWIRACILYFGHDNKGRHPKMLNSFKAIFEELGHPWETFMTCMQLSHYAMVRGDFETLRHLSQRLQEISRVTGDGNALAVALHCQSVASGGRVPVEKGEPTERRSTFMKFHRVLAQVQCLSSRGQHEEAWTAVQDQRSLMKLDLALIEARKATTARRWAEATPRRWKQRRKELFNRALAASHRCLKTGPMGRLWHIRAKREMALALVGLGRSQEALSWIARSLQDAHHLQATYEEALTRQAWGQIGLGLNWPDSAQHLSRGQNMLEKLGAWWDLGPESAGLPLQEVSQDARDFLLRPNNETRQQLARWVQPQWTEQLNQIHLQSQQLRHQQVTTTARLKTQLARWQAFLEQGPVAVRRFDSNGRWLDGHREAYGVDHHVELDQGEYALVTLPIARTAFEPCRNLLRSEIAELSRLMGEHGLSAEQLPPSRHATLLAENYANLQRWHLESQPPPWQQGWFGHESLVEQSGELPWTDLSEEARSALQGILREALQNCQKHRPQSPISIHGRIEKRQFLLRVRSSGSSAPPSTRSFGLESMRFRASLAGGRLQVDPDFTLHLWLPLATGNDHSAHKFQPSCPPPSES